MEKLMTATRLPDPLGTEAAVRDRSVIDQLRTRASHQLTELESTRPTVARVTTIVSDLIAGRTLDQTAAKMGQPSRELNVNLVLGVIARYGTWLTHTLEVNEVEPVYAADLGPKTKPPVDKIVIPLGYEPANNGGRDIARALAAVVANKPNAEITARFVDRTYRIRSSSLTYHMVTSVWGFASRGRIPRIQKVSDDPTFHMEIAAAYDLLDVARSDAQKAIEQLLSIRNPLDQEKIGLVRDNLLKCRWVHEGEISRLLRTAETSLLRAASVPLLERELDALRVRAEEPGSPWNIRSVGALNAGQVRRIAAVAGLTVDPVTKSNESSIRATLRSMGLSSDADKLVPEALRASDRNLLEEFWNVLQSRLEGDVTWSEQLEELLA
jgi:hypothetical protein